MAESSKNQIFEIGVFRLDPLARTLHHKGRAVVLTAKVFDTLLYLVKNGGRLIDKDELMREIWSDTFVEENNLNKNISMLRQVLGEKPGEHKFIVTLPGKGYKFVAPVTLVQGTAHPVLQERHAEETDAADSVPLLPINLNKTNRSTGRHLMIILVLASIAAVSIIGTLLYLDLVRERTGADSRLTRLAVLPFKPLVIDSRDEALELGIAETLIAHLSSSSDLHVRPLGSVRKFSAVDQDSQAAGKALGVDAVLDGSIQRSGNEIRVIVRLLDVATGITTWNGTYDEQFTNIFAVQDRIAGRVAKSLNIRLNELQNGAGKHQTENAEAYLLYLQGRYFAQKSTPAEVRRGIEYFQEAIDTDPSYALAYAGMADAYRTLPINADIRSEDAMPRARAAALKALEFDPQLADAHIALGYIDFWYEHDWIKAETEFKTAIEISPDNADAHRGYSVLLSCLGRHDEAIREMSTARNLDPLSLITGALEGQAFLFAGKYEEATNRLNKTLELDPNFWVAHLQLARIHIQQNNLEAAIAAGERAKESSGGNSEAIALIGYAAAKAGMSQRAADAMRSLQDIESKGLVVDYNTALVYLGLGETDPALAALRQGVENKDVRLILLKVDPRWDELRSEPRFRGIMRQLNLE